MYAAPIALLRKFGEVDRGMDRLRQVRRKGLPCSSARLTRLFDVERRGGRDWVWEGGAGSVLMLLLMLMLLLACSFTCSKSSRTIKRGKKGRKGSVLLACCLLACVRACLYL